MIKMDEKEIEIKKGEKGIIDLVDRILADIIATPFVKQILREILSEIDPKSASKLIRTLIWGDIEVLADIGGAIIPLVNTIGEVLNELGKTLQRSLPTTILSSIDIGSIIREIDIDTIVEGINSILTFLSSLLEKDTKMLSDIISGFVYDLLSSIDDETLGRTIGDIIKIGIPALVNPKMIGLLFNNLLKLIKGLLESVKIGDLLSGLIESVLPKDKGFSPLLEALTKMFDSLFGTPT